VVSATAPRTGVIVVRAVGEIDLLTAPGWRRVLTAVTRMLGSAPPQPTRAPTDARRGPAHRAPRLVCDLSPVSFLGASGLSVLVDLAEHTSRAGIELCVVAGTRAVRRLLEFTALDRHLAVSPRLDSAVASTASTGAAW
jgi:anti-anti-sigma regulatory factor